ncbi:hypothetical protein DL93DRAFT_2120902 [Clavulina sp. PMI_390]|nr:hypothetical protein DL93DRAFT_2120902 [Clavulina sp. PMI_390]
MFSKTNLAIAAIAVSAQGAYAWWRVSCPSPLVSERVDPIISPGVSPSQHVHTIHGGSNFAPNSTYDSLVASKCTSCLVNQDHSNYWFPKLYFHDPSSGTFTEVPNGGLLIYYQDRGDLAKINGGPGLKAFPPGFKMLSGNPARRSMNAPTTDNTQWGLGQRAQFFSCLRYTGGQTGYDTFGFPNTNCESGLNSRIHMPACWDGVNLDSADHVSHTAFLSEIDNGSCPPTHPVGLMKLFYEVTWDINSFVTSGRWNPATATFPFVLATGDPTGYSWHGDFQMGWSNFQQAIDTCQNPNDGTGQGITEDCSVFTEQTATQAEACTIAPIVKETITGNLAKLPGCNPIQNGPANATIYTDANCPK